MNEFPVAAAQITTNVVARNLKINTEPLNPKVLPSPGKDTSLAKPLHCRFASSILPLSAPFKDPCVDALAALTIQADLPNAS